MTRHVRPDFCKLPKIADPTQARNATLTGILKVVPTASADNREQEDDRVKMEGGIFADPILFLPNGISWWVYVQENTGYVFGITRAGDLYEAAASFRAVTKDAAGSRVVTLTQAMKVVTWLLEEEDSPPVLLGGE